MADKIEKSFPENVETNICHTSNKSSNRETNITNK